LRFPGNRPFLCQSESDPPMSNHERVQLPGSFRTGRRGRLAAAVVTAACLGSACGTSARTPGDDAESAAVSGSSQAAGRAGDAALASAGPGQKPSGQGSAASAAAGSGGTGAAVAAAADGGVRATGAGGASGVDAGAALEPRSECRCNGSGAKVPIEPFTARPHEVRNEIVLKFVDGARTLALEVGIGFRARERSSQDLAELECVQLEADAADSALVAINEVLAASPSISIEPVFPGAASSHDGERDFNGRHCVAAGEEALADLTNYYTLHILDSDGPRLMRAFDESPLVQTAYFAPEPAPPP
jgi:hypothetical protein